MGLIKQNKSGLLWSKREVSSMVVDLWSQARWVLHLKDGFISFKRIILKEVKRPSELWK